MQKIPTREWVQFEKRLSEKIFAEVVIQNANPTQVDKAISDGLYLLPGVSRTSGPSVYRKLNTTPDQLWGFLNTDDVKVNATRKTSLAERIAQELAFDATMMVLKDPKYNAIARLNEIIELSGETLPLNYDALVGQAIERDPNVIKFSKVQALENIVKIGAIQVDPSISTENLDKIINLLIGGYKSQDFNNLIRSIYPNDIVDKTNGFKDFASTYGGIMDVLGREINMRENDVKYRDTYVSSLQDKLVDSGLVIDVNNAQNYEVSILKGNKPVSKIELKYGSVENGPYLTSTVLKNVFNSDGSIKAKEDVKLNRSTGVDENIINSMFSDSVFMDKLKSVIDIAKKYNSTKIVDNGFIIQNEEERSDFLREVGQRPVHRYSDPLFTNEKQLAEMKKDVDAYHFSKDGIFEIPGSNLGLRPLNITTENSIGISYSGGGRFNVIMTLTAKELNTTESFESNDINSETGLEVLSNKLKEKHGEKIVEDQAPSSINYSESTSIPSPFNNVKYSKKHRQEYEENLKKKRSDLTDKEVSKQVDSIFEFVDNIPFQDSKKRKMELLALHFMNSKGFILPEDDYKLLEAERISSIVKIDPFLYKNVDDLIEEHGEKVKPAYIDPDNIKTLNNKRVYPDGITIYTAEDSVESQEKLSDIVTSHLGRKSSPWCITNRDKSTGRTNKDVWDKYGTEKQVVFQNGKIISIGTKSLLEENVIIDEIISQSKDYPGLTSVIYDAEANDIFFEMINEYEVSMNPEEAVENNVTTEENVRALRLKARELVKNKEVIYKWWDKQDTPRSGIVYNKKEGTSINKQLFNPSSNTYKTLSSIDVINENGVKTIINYNVNEDGTRSLPIEKSVFYKEGELSVEEKYAYLINGLKLNSIIKKDADKKKVYSLGSEKLGYDRRITSEFFYDKDGYITKEIKSINFDGGENSLISRSIKEYKNRAVDTIKIVAHGGNKMHVVLNKDGILYREQDGKRFITKLDQLYNDYVSKLQRFTFTEIGAIPSEYPNDVLFDVYDDIVLKEVRNESYKYWGGVEKKKIIESVGGFPLTNERFSKAEMLLTKRKEELAQQIIPLSEVKFSKAKKQKTRDVLDISFNIILEQTTGIKALKEYSRTQAKAASQRKKRRSFFIPPSAEDFLGLMYAFLSPGSVGEQQLDFFNKNLITPMNEAFNNWAQAKYVVARDFRALRTKYKGVTKKLNKFVQGTDFTIDQAIRVYLYDKAGYEVPGISQSEINSINRFMVTNIDVYNFANELRKVTRIPAGFKKPDENWISSTLTSEMYEISQDVVRGQFFTKVKENLDNIFTESNLNKIEAYYGLKFREALEDSIYRIKTGSNRTFGGNRQLNAFNDWLNGSVGVIMFLNTRSAVLQLISATNYINWSDNNMIKAAAAFGNQQQYWSDFVTLFNSPYLKERRSGLQSDLNLAELQSAVAGGKNKPKAVISYLLQKGFILTQTADSFAIASGGATFYRNRINSYLKQGFGQDRAAELAFTDFQNLTETNQQSARPDKISQEQAGPLGRLILAFQNTPAQYAREMKKASLDLINGRGDWKTNLSKIAYYGAVQNLIFNAMQTALFALLFDDEEEEKEDDEQSYLKKFRTVNGMVDSILRGTGVAGAITATVKNTIIKFIEENEKGYKADNAAIIVEALNVSPPIGSKARKLKSAFDTYKYNKDIVHKYGYDIDNPLVKVSSDVISVSTNVPTDRILRKVDNLSGALDADNAMWQRLLLTAGWSKWDVGIVDEKRPLFKEQLKQEKKEAKKEEAKKKRIQGNDRVPTYGRSTNNERQGIKRG